jgi:preprotein translocase YajC subunit
MSLITLIAMFCFVFFLNFAVIRPHKREQKRLASILESVAEGRVVYAAGIRGTVLEVRRDSIVMASGPRHTLLEIDSSAVEAVEKPIDR